jgi:glycosyltransferase involved in cell wall biosynthesis
MQSVYLMKKVYWITPECFLDVDMPVIEHLTGEFNIMWLIIGFDKSSRGMYTKTGIDHFATKNHVSYAIEPQEFRFSNPLIIQFYLRIIERIKKFQPDIVYTSYLGEPIFLNMLRLFYPAEKAVIANHDIELHSSEKKRWIKKLYHDSYRKIYSNFHLFSDSQANLFSHLFKNKNLLITSLCIKDFGRPSSMYKSEKVRFLFFGSILPYKGLDILIKAINVLSENHTSTNFSLTIAGNCSASDWSEYEKIIEFPQFIKTEIRVIKNSEIADLFCNSDYLVLPYRDVTQCGPLMIAFNYSVPVIATDLPGFRDYITDKGNGFLFENNDYKKLAEIMTDCIQNNRHDLLSGNMSRIAGEKFSPQIIAKQYSQYFKRLMNHR